MEDKYWQKAGKSKAKIEAEEIRDFILKHKKGKISSFASTEEENLYLNTAIESAINWYQVCPYATIVIGKRDRKVRKKIKDNLYGFVKRDLQKVNVATGFLSSLIASWVISAVTKWVVSKLLQYLFSRD